MLQRPAYFEQIAYLRGTFFGLWDFLRGAQGSVAVTGFFQFEAVFGEGEPGQTSIEAARNERSLFAARYTADGSLLWARTSGYMAEAGHECEGDLNQWEGGRGLAVLPGNRLAVIGAFGRPATFDRADGAETTLVPEGKADLFIARFDPEGAVDWVEGIGGAEVDLGYDVAATPKGGLVAIGDFKTAVVFGLGTSWETTLDGADASGEAQSEAESTAPDIFLLYLAPR